MWRPYIHLALRDFSLDYKFSNSPANHWLVRNVYSSKKKIIWAFKINRFLTLYPRLGFHTARILRTGKGLQILQDFPSDGDPHIRKFMSRSILVRRTLSPLFVHAWCYSMGLLDPGVNPEFPSTTVSTL